MNKVFYKKKRIKDVQFGHWIDSETEFVIMGMTDGEDSFDHPHIKTKVKYFETTNLKVVKEKGKMKLKVTKKSLYQTQKEIDEIKKKKEDKWAKATDRKQKLQDKDLKKKATKAAKNK